jgi:serine/threonine-protein kinase
VYSLGCTLYQLLTGSVPFPQGDTQQKLRARVNADAKDARIIHQAVPFDLAELLRDMLARNPAERITLLEVIRRLEAWCAE